MTFDASEISIQSGQPVELYQFTTTPAVGVGVLGAAELWQYDDEAGRDLVWTADSNDASGTLDNGTGGVVEFNTIAFSGGIGEGGGYAKITRTFTAADGLAPSTSYRVSCFATRSRDTGFLVAGMEVDNGGPDQTAHFTGGALSQNLQQTITSSAGAEITVELGQFDMEYGMSALSLVFGPVIIEAAATLTAETTELNYTSADVSITFDGDVYAPAIFRRSNVTAGNAESGGRGFEIEMPSDHAVALLFRGRRLSAAPVSLTHYRLHRSALTDEITPFKGQVTGARFEGASCFLTVATAAMLLARKIPRQFTQRLCPHMLYDANTCQASAALHAYTQAEVTAISGRTVTIDGLDASVPVDDPDPTGYYDGGVLITAGGERAHIVSRAVDVVTLLEAVDGLAVSDLVDVLAACSRETAVCDGRFHNIRHFGGEPGMPERNMFTGSGLG